MPWRCPDRTGTVVCVSASALTSTARAWSAGYSQPAASDVSGAALFIEISRPAPVPSAGTRTAAATQVRQRTRRDWVGSLPRTPRGTGTREGRAEVAARNPGGPSRFSSARTSAMLAPGASVSSRCAAIISCSSSACATGSDAQAASRARRYSLTCGRASTESLIAGLLRPGARRRAWRREQDRGDGRGELGPVGAEGLQLVAPLVGDEVVPAGPLPRRVAPLAGHQPCSTKPAEQRVHGAVAGQQAARGGQLADKLQAEPGALVEQREHARAENAAPQLGHARITAHAAHDVLPHKTSQQANGSPWSAALDRTNVFECPAPSRRPGSSSYGEPFGSPPRVSALSRSG